MLTYNHIYIKYHIQNKQQSNDDMLCKYQAAAIIKHAAYTFHYNLVRENTHVKILIQT